MKSTFITVIIILSALMVSSQNEYVSGYLIDNNADTIIGKIYQTTKPGKGKVVFRDAEGKKKTYYPRQINGFVINDTMQYQSILQIENADAAAYHVFGMKIITGRFNLLATQNKITAIFADEEQQDVNNFYIEDSETGEFYKLTRMGYRKQLAARVSENNELKREVRNKVYDYEEIPEVIAKFNDWFRDKKHQ